MVIIGFCYFYSKPSKPLTKNCISKAMENISLNTLLQTAEQFRPLFLGQLFCKTNTAGSVWSPIPFTLGDIVKVKRNEDENYYFQILSAAAQELFDASMQTIKITFPSL